MGLASWSQGQGGQAESVWSRKGTLPAGTMWPGCQGLSSWSLYGSVGAPCPRFYPDRKDSLTADQPWRDHPKVWNRGVLWLHLTQICFLVGGCSAWPLASVPWIEGILKITFLFPLLLYVHICFIKLGMQKKIKKIKNTGNSILKKQTQLISVVIITLTSLVYFFQTERYHLTHPISFY